jgi:simple sugar transport system substrate-binding protein
MYKPKSLAAVCVAGLIGLAGCGSDGGSGGGSGGSASSSGGEKLTVGYVQLHADTYFTQVEKGLKEALGSNGELVSVSYDDDAGKEAMAYQNLISRRVDAIVTSPFDPKGSVSGIKRAAEAGIPVICINTCINDADAKKYIKGFVLSDNTALGTSTGEYAAKYIKDKLGGKAVVADLNCDTFDVCKLRKKGFYDALTNAGIDYKLAASQTAYLPDKTVPAATAIMTAHPDVNVIWSATDGGGAGAVKAIDSANKDGKVAVFSTDMTASLGAALTDGKHILFATTGQDGVAQGKKAIEVVRGAVDGKTSQPFQQLIPGQLFTTEDKPAVEQWMAENK